MRMGKQTKDGAFTVFIEGHLGEDDPVSPQSLRYLTRTLMDIARQVTDMAKERALRHAAEAPPQAETLH